MGISKQILQDEKIHIQRLIGDKSLLKEKLEKQIEEADSFIKNRKTEIEEIDRAILTLEGF